MQNAVSSVQRRLHLLDSNHTIRLSNWSFFAIFLLKPFDLMLIFYKHFFPTSRIIAELMSFGRSHWHWWFWGLNCIANSLGLDLLWMKVDMFMPEARYCSTGFAIKYHIHVCVCDPLLQYGGIFWLLKKKNQKSQNQKIEKRQNQLNNSH